MDKLTIEFDFVCPSGWAYVRNWKKYKGYQVLMGWNRKFDACLKGYGLVKKYVAKEKRKVVVTRYTSKRRFIKDYKNLIGSYTPLMDALVRAKLLVDDSMKWVDEIYNQEVGEEKTKVVITW